MDAAGAIIGGGAASALIGSSATILKAKAPKTNIPVKLTVI